MEEIQEVVLFLEERGTFIYEINDIGHYNLLVNYLDIPTDRLFGGQGISCYNLLSIKYLTEILGLSSVAIPMELDSRGIVKLTQDNSNHKSLQFTELSRVPVMYSRVDSEEFFEGAEFTDNIGTVFYVHKYNDINIFIAKEFYSGENCVDLEGIHFSSIVHDSFCLGHKEVQRKTFNLQRRLH